MLKVVEHGLGHLPFSEKQITTPTGSVYTGVVFCERLCGVSIIRRYIIDHPILLVSLVHNDSSIASVGRAWRTRCGRVVKASKSAKS